MSEVIIKLEDLKKETVNFKDGDKDVELIDILHNVSFDIPGLDKADKE